MVVFPPAQHHPGAFNADYKRPGVAVAYDGYFHVEQKTHSGKPAVQTATGSDAG